MGQPSNIMMNRVGKFMYWGNNWVLNLKSSNFQIKVILIQKLIFDFFSDNLFFFFFKKNLINLKLFKQKKSVTIHKHINHTQNEINNKTINNFFFFKTMVY